jgi:SAM-dependent methyltransferase
MGRINAVRAGRAPPDGSYHFDRLELQSIEARFLAERAQLRLDGFPELLERHRFPTRGRALEIGCGYGLRAQIMASRFPDIEVVALDRSQALSAAARGDSRVMALCADLYDLPFPECSFDFIYARLVFMHLRDPLAALRGLGRALRRGGRILIEDADRDCMFFEPAPEGLGSFWGKVQEGQRRMGGDPNIGRKLAPYFKEAGFHDLAVEAQPTVGGAHEIELMARTLLPSLAMYLEPQDRGEAETAIRALARLAESPLATFYHFWFAVSGAKPG